MPEKSQTKKIFRLRPKAESDLENIYAYSYKEFGLSKAEYYIHDLLLRHMKRIPCIQDCL